MRRPLLFLFLLTLAPFAGTARAASPTPQPPLYPTDACVASKLAAAGTACRAVFDALAFHEIDPRLPAVDPAIAAAKTALAKAWSAAEARSLADGVDCKDTTATSDAVFTTITDGTTGIAAQIHTAVADAKFLKAFRAFGGLRAAGDACSQLVAAEGRHLLVRNVDRTRTRLTRENAAASGILELLLRWSALGKDGAATVTASVKSLAKNVVFANEVSPSVPSSFVMITPSAQVPYQGKTLEPICSAGTPWVYFAKRGTVNKLLVYYQGGGACWDYLTCAVLNTYKPTAGPGDNPANSTAGFADLSNPANPFRDWNVVFVPYCTGDVHWGDATVVHSLGTNAPVTIQHKGFVNAQVAEKFAREHFVDPDEVFVTGSSAGAYGAILNGLYLQEGVYPSSDFATLGDAGNGVVPQSFLATEISKWGIANTLPKWIPALNKPVTELDASALWAESANFYKTHRFANYATAYDGGSGGQAGFYRVMTEPNFLHWAQWWLASCPWHDGMEAQIAGAYAGAPQNYRYYVGSGARHTMWGSNKVYTDTTGGVPTLVSWVDAMLTNGPAWVNVQTTDPGLLLPGDPKPNPIAAPYTADGRIVCTPQPGPVAPPE